MFALNSTSFSSNGPVNPAPAGNIPFVLQNAGGAVPSTMTQLQASSSLQGFFASNKQFNVAIDQPEDVNQSVDYSKFTKADIKKILARPGLPLSLRKMLELYGEKIQLGDGSNEKLQPAMDKVELASENAGNKKRTPDDDEITCSFFANYAALAAAEETCTEFMLPPDCKGSYMTCIVVNSASTDENFTLGTKYNFGVYKDKAVVGDFIEFVPDDQSSENKKDSPYHIGVVFAQDEKNYYVAGKVTSVDANGNKISSVRIGTVSKRFKPRIFHPVYNDKEGVDTSSKITQLAVNSSANTATSSGQPTQSTPRREPATTSQSSSASTAQSTPSQTEQSTQSAQTSSSEKSETKQSAQEAETEQTLEINADNIMNGQYKVGDKLSNGSEVIDVKTVRDTSSAFAAAPLLEITIRTKDGRIFVKRCEPPLDWNKKDYPNKTTVKTGIVTIEASKSAVMQKMNATQNGDSGKVTWQGFKALLEESGKLVTEAGLKLQEYTHNEATGKKDKATGKWITTTSGAYCEPELMSGITNFSYSHWDQLLEGVGLTAYKGRVRPDVAAKATFDNGWGISFEDFVPLLIAEMRKDYDKAHPGNKASDHDVLVWALKGGGKA